MNKTPLSARTNRIIGRNAPSGYLPRIMKNADIPEERMREILESHVIDPDALMNDDFEAFFQARQGALLERIEAAMGKPVARDAVEEPVPVGADDTEDEDDSDEDAEE